MRFWWLPACCDSSSSLSSSSSSSSSGDEEEETDEDEEAGVSRSGMRHLQQRLELSCFDEQEAQPAATLFPLGRVCAVLPRLRELVLTDVQAPPVVQGSQEVQALARVQRLTLRYCRMPDLIGEVARIVPNLTELDVSYCRAERVSGSSSGADDGGASLERLSVLTALTSLRIRGCYSLIQSGGNNAHSTPWLFGALRRLSLPDNSLSRVPTAVIRAQRLEMLDLSDNFFTYLPGEAFSAPKSGLGATLRHLDLSSCHLGSFCWPLRQPPLPDSISTLSRLEALNLAHNRHLFVALSPSSVAPLWRLPRLRILDLRQTGLRSATLAELCRSATLSTSLTDLCLAQNPICCLPIELLRLTALVALSLASHSMVDAAAGDDLRRGDGDRGPDEAASDGDQDAAGRSTATLAFLASICSLIPQMIALERLDLCGNSRFALPATLSRLVSLRSLTLEVPLQMPPELFLLELESLTGHRDDGGGNNEETWLQFSWPNVQRRLRLDLQRRMGGDGRMRPLPLLLLVCHWINAPQRRELFSQHALDVLPAELRELIRKPRGVRASE